jgi:hypothetical protein
MKFLEKTLEDIIYNNLKEMSTRGLDLFKRRGSYFSVSRQVGLGGYGVADLITVEWSQTVWETGRYITVTIIECKLNTIDINAYMQVQRYKTAINSILDEFDLSRTELIVKTVLIGSELSTKGDFVYVLNGDKDCDVYTYSYDFDGIKFENQGRGWRQKEANLPVQTLKTTFLKGFKRYHGELINKKEVNAGTE